MSFLYTDKKLNKFTNVLGNRATGANRDSGQQPYEQLSPLRLMDFVLSAHVEAELERSE